MYGGTIDPESGWESWDPNWFTSLWQRFVERWTERNAEVNLVSRVVRGDWTVVDRNARPLSVKSPNVIQVGLEDTAAAASMVPTVRVHASDPSDEKSEHRAAQMERLGASYLKRAGGKLLYQKSSLAGGAFGYAAWQVVNDGPNGKVGSIPQWRDPQGCYPEPDVDEIGVASRMFHVRDVYLTQLAPEHATIFVEHCAEHLDKHGRKDPLDHTWFWDHPLTMLEYSDENRVTIGLAYNSAKARNLKGHVPETDAAKWVSVIVEDFENKAKMCRGIYGQWPSLDGEPHGQYTQVVPVLHAHMRLVAMALEHANQAVYNELVVIDPIGDVPQGPDAVIELGPQGKAFRLPPATVGFSFFEETNRLLDAVHVGARWPKQRTGEIVQSQESGKHLEGALGVQNAVISTHHTILQQMTDRALNVCFALDKAEGPKRTAAGILRNQQFQIAFERDDIDLAAEVCSEYGFGYGRDVAQSAVIAIQLKGAGLISNLDAQENYPGITDVARTQSRILAEEVAAQLKAAMWMKLQTGEVDPEQVLDLLDDIERGLLFPEVYRKYIVNPQRKKLRSSLGGMLTPGPGPGGQVPPAPNPMDVLGMLGGGPQAPSTINRLSIPMGEGSFAGSQVGG